MASVILEVQTTRYGFIIVPYKPSLGFDYNKNYSTIDSIVWDFSLNGYDLISVEDRMYEFQRGESMRL